jgi:hypothetical protein
MEICLLGGSWFATYDDGAHQEWDRAVVALSQDDDLLYLNRTYEELCVPLCPEFQTGGFVNISRRDWVILCELMDEVLARYPILTEDD